LYFLAISSPGNIVSGYPDWSIPMLKIGPLAVAVLGLLVEQPRHPYDIAYTMQQRHMNEHIKLSMGTLYHVVEQLQRLDWIRPTETAREGRRPERTTYEVTPEGHRQLLDRIRQLVAEPAREYSAFEAGLTFLHQLPPDEAVLLLRRRADALREQIELWDYTVERLHGRGLARLALIEAELVQDTRRFQRDWATRVADEIENGTLEWAVHCAPLADTTEVSQ
jgi:DNA-binding PadR family transcriptional regulator